MEGWQGAIHRNVVCIFAGVSYDQASLSMITNLQTHPTMRAGVPVCCKFLHGGSSYHEKTPDACLGDCQRLETASWGFFNLRSRCHCTCSISIGSRSACTCALGVMYSPINHFGLSSRLRVPAYHCLIPQLLLAAVEARLLSTLQGCRPLSRTDIAQVPAQIDEQHHLGCTQPSRRQICSTQKAY